MPWQIFYYDMEGGGYWVYHSADHWATDPKQEPGFGAVAFDGRELVTTRRWEATRDGIEDFNMLDMLRKCLNQKPDKEIQKLLDESVASVVHKTLTRTWRDATDYDLEYAEFRSNREKLGRALERLQ